MLNFEIKAHDFALTKSLEVVTVLNIKGMTAICVRNFDENNVVGMPKKDLIKLDDKSGILAIKKLESRKKELDDKIGQIDQHLMVLEELGK